MYLLIIFSFLDKLKSNFNRVVKSMGNTISIIALIFGIISFCCGVIFGPVAIILGAIGMRGEEGRGMATAGLVLGIVSLLCWILAIIFLWAFIAALFGFGGGLVFL